METHAERATSEEFHAALRAGCEDLKLDISEDEIRGMELHYQLMLDANERMNLTRITHPAEAAVKHYADALALLPWADAALPAEVSVLDVGTGAGFPAVPLAICRPRWSILAVDSTRKKIDFLDTAVAQVGLSNVATRHVRARELANEPDRFDLAVARAVGDPLASMRETRRSLGPGGRLACYVTPATLEELDASHVRKAERLGFVEMQRIEYTLGLRGERIERALAVWRRM